MRTLVIGSKGRQGKRFCTIVRHLKEDLVEADIGDQWWKFKFDRAIVATPTQAHFSDLVMLLESGKPALCEKPITKSKRLLQTLINACGSDKIRMVNNWQYAVSLALQRGRGPTGGKGASANLGEMEIEYKSFQTGEDGLFWDCIQLLYLAGRFKWDTSYPSWECLVDGQHEVTLKDIQDSYVMMVSDWLYSPTPQLWTLEDARKAGEKVEWALAHHKETLKGEINFQEMAALPCK